MTKTITLNQAVRKARDVYIFTVVRWADENDSACGYVRLPKAEVLFQVRRGFLQGGAPEFRLDEDGDLYIG